MIGATKDFQVRIAGSKATKAVKFIGKSVTVQL
jgi:hypothetical protein